MATYVTFSVPDGVYRELMEKGGAIDLSPTLYAKYLLFSHLATSQPDDVREYKREYDRRMNNAVRTVAPKPIGMHGVN